jgi:hypothetical protein
MFFFVENIVTVIHQKYQYQPVIEWKMGITNFEEYDSTK